MRSSSRTGFFEAVAASPTPVRRRRGRCRAGHQRRRDAADALAELDDKLDAAGIELCFAELKDPVKDKLKRFGLYDRFGETFFFPTIGQAVDDYLKTYNVDWVDWEDRRG